MTTPLHPYLFVSARPDLDKPKRIPRYGPYNGLPCRIVASLDTRSGRQAHEVAFEDGTRFWCGDYELVKDVPHA